jgi:hypothetical protein
LPGSATKHFVAIILRQRLEVKISVKRAYRRIVSGIL